LAEGGTRGRKKKERVKRREGESKGVVRTTMKKCCQVMSADSVEQHGKSVWFGVHTFRDFRVSPDAEPDEWSGSAYWLNFEPDHRSGSASVRSELKFGTELCHHYNY
jgi:hypothetical protein